MEYRGIPKDKRDDVVTIHTVETTEKVTNYYQVVGLNKMQAREAVNNDGYYSKKGSSPTDDLLYINIEADEHRNYGGEGAARINDTSQYQPCGNYGEILFRRNVRMPVGNMFGSTKSCHQIIFIKDWSTVSLPRLEQTNPLKRPLCRYCQRHIADGYRVLKGETAKREYEEMFLVGTQEVGLND